MSIKYVLDRILTGVGWRLKLERIKKLPDEIVARFRQQEQEIKKARKDFVVIEEFRDESQAHPVHYRTFECEFASEKISLVNPSSLLDIGSYRDWLAGLMAHYPVTTVDVRDRESNLSNESIINQDVCEFQMEDETVEMVISLHTIEHFGLGRYGDKFDPDGDKKAIGHMQRIIKQGGHFLFSVPVTGGDACIAFNSHRIYSMGMVREFVRHLTLVDEVFIKRKPARLCSESELATELGEFDVYCGYYTKS